MILLADCDGILLGVGFWFLKNDSESQNLDPDSVLGGAVGKMRVWGF